MPTYTPDNENITVHPDFPGAPVVQPNHRCAMCAKATEQQYTRCFKCAHTGENRVGDDLHKVFAVGIYVEEETDGTLTGRIEAESGRWDADVLHEFSEEIRAAKDGDHVDKMARVFGWGIRNYDALANFDLVVPSPSGSTDTPGANHLVPICDRVESMVGIPHRNVARGDYESQRRQDGLEERIENVRGGVWLADSALDADRALVVDDVATTCATLSDTARALHEAGVRDVLGLVLGRNEDYRSLERADVLTTDR